MPLKSLPLDNNQFFLDKPYKECILGSMMSPKSLPDLQAHESPAIWHRYPPPFLSNSCTHHADELNICKLA